MDQSLFPALNPYRSPEFNRDWNLANSLTGMQHLGNAGLQIANDSAGLQASYQLGAFFQPDSYEGWRQNGRLAWKCPRLGPRSAGQLPEKAPGRRRRPVFSARNSRSKNAFPP